MIEACLASAEAGAAVSVPFARLVAASGVSSSVVHLAQGVSQAMILSQMKAAALPFVVMGAVASGIVLGAAQGQV